MVSVITELNGCCYNVEVSSLQELLFLGKKVVYRTIKEPGNSRVIVLGFLIKKEAQKVFVIQGIEVRKIPRYQIQITQDQKEQLETLLRQESGINNIVFWPGSFSPLT